MKELIEVNLIKSFLNVLTGIPGKKEVSKKEISEIEKEAEEIFREIFTGHNPRKTHKDKSDLSSLYVYKVKLNEIEYDVKMVVVYSNESVNISMWNEDELISILTTGELKYKYKLRAVGKSKLKELIK